MEGRSEDMGQAPLKDTEGRWKDMERGVMPALDAACSMSLVRCLEGGPYPPHFDTAESAALFTSRGSRPLG